jgi:hypothetical protein
MEGRAKLGMLYPIKSSFVVVISNSLWITGSAKSGKTEALIVQLDQWMADLAQHSEKDTTPSVKPIGKQISEDPPAQPRSAHPHLVFAANADNRTVLMQRIAQQVKGRDTILSTTPLAFFESEVLLFWPLVIQQLGLRGYFPYRLRPETEQALALRLWCNSAHDPAIATLQEFEFATADQWGRRILDLIQLAASSGTPLDTLATKLTIGEDSLKVPEAIAALIQQLVLDWKDWCLQQGILTYGLITDLFGQCLLTHDTYLNQLPQRFSTLAADDVDNYPKITRLLFERSLNLGLPGIFTYSPTGGIRKGLGADPDAFLTLRDRCTEITLPSIFALESIHETDAIGLNFPEQDLEIYTIQTISRTQLLQEVAQQVISAIQEGAARPQDIALIGPGLDPLSRYALIDSLQAQGILVEPLREQRSLQSSAIVRALLTLLALVYPGLGHWIETEQIAEMLVILTEPGARTSPQGIDPVRAALLADYCFQPHPEHPQLLPMETFLRWDRLGYAAAAAYERIRLWIAQQQGAIQQTTPQPVTSSIATSTTATSTITTAVPAKSPYLTLSPVFILDRAIQTFLMQRPLSLEQLAALRELIETAQHYWEVDARLRKTELDWPTLSEAIANFIDLLRRGVITANPYPVGNQQTRSAVVLATSFQYLNARLQHPWQYWLDAGSQLWQYGGEVDLWGAPLFLSSPSSEPTPFHSGRMSATLAELVSRTQSRIYLCHSDLAVNGQSQMGPLMPWVETAIPYMPIGNAEE